MAARGINTSSQGWKLHRLNCVQVQFPGRLLRSAIPFKDLESNAYARATRAHRLFREPVAMNNRRHRHEPSAQAFLEPG